MGRWSLRNSHRRRIASHAQHGGQQRRDRAVARLQLSRADASPATSSSPRRDSIRFSWPSLCWTSLAVSTSRALMRSRSAAILSRSPAAPWSAAPWPPAGRGRSRGACGPRRARAALRRGEQGQSSDAGRGNATRVRILSACATSLPNPPSMDAKPNDQGPSKSPIDQNVCRILYKRSRQLWHG